MPEQSSERRARQVLALAGGMCAVLIALATPLDAAADRDMRAHMVQHVLLLSVAAPLLALAAPFLLAVDALPSRARPAPRRILARLARSQSRHWFVWTAGSLALAAFTLGAWHTPVLYDAALRHGALHALEHATFVATAALFWWMALRAGRRDRRGFGVLAVFLSSLPATALGLLMTVSATAWYAPYGHDATALAQQQVAGAVMWGIGGIALVVCGAGLFASWLARLDRADREANARVVADPC
jgi:putative membrane protein